MSKYLESEEEKRINYLKRKLLQWNANAKKLSLEGARNKVARWTEQRYKLGVARKNWKDLVNKYDMYVNKYLLFQVKSRLRNWLKLRDMAEKVRYRFTKVGSDQFKDGLEFKKILLLMRQLFENWDERNKFLAKRFILRKWYMQVKKLRERDQVFDKAMSLLDKKTLHDNVNTLNDACLTNKVLNAVPVARAKDFFANLRKVWGDWDKIRKQVMAILGKYVENEEEKRINYLKRKLHQWNETAKKISSEAAKNKLARWTGERYKVSKARKKWKDLVDKYDMFKNNSLLWDLRRRLLNNLRLRDMVNKLKRDFTKVGYDQFKEGANFNNKVRYLRNIFTNDDRYYYPYKQQYFHRWIDNTRKLREREDALKESFTLMSKKSFNMAADAVKNACLVRAIKSIVPVARSYDFLDRLKRLAERNSDYSKFKGNLVSVKDEVDAEAKNKLLQRLYKVYYYKLLDGLFGKLGNLQKDYKKDHANYFFYKLLLSKRDFNKKEDSLEVTPKQMKMTFKGKANKKLKAPEDRSVLKMILPSLIKFLDDKFLEQKDWAMENLLNKYRSEKFAKLFKIFSNKATNHQREI